MMATQSADMLVSTVSCVLTAEACLLSDIAPEHAENALQGIEEQEEGDIDEEGEYEENGEVADGDLDGKPGSQPILLLRSG